MATHGSGRAVLGARLPHPAGNPSNVHPAGSCHQTAKERRPLVASQLPSPHSATSIWPNIDQRLQWGYQ